MVISQVQTCNEEPAYSHTATLVSKDQRPSVLGSTANVPHVLCHLWYGFCCGYPISCNRTGINNQGGPALVMPSVCEGYLTGILRW